MKETGRVSPARIAGLLFTAATLLMAALLIFQCADIFITGTSSQNISETGVYIHDVYSREIVAERLSHITWVLVLWLVTLIAALFARIVSPEEKRSMSRLSAEARLALMRSRVTATTAMLAEQRKRRLAQAVCLAVCAGCAVAACLYLLDTTHFASRDLEAVMGAMLLHVTPWIALAFAVLLVLAQARHASIERELEAAKQAPKRQPEMPTARKTNLVVGRVILCAAAIALLIAGIMNGGMYDVLVKAINICTECIGLG